MAYQIADAARVLPETVALSLLKFWQDPTVSEWGVSRYDKEWKIKTVGYQKGKS
jgi:hypothetical protein